MYIKQLFPESLIKYIFDILLTDRANFKKVMGMFEIKILSSLFALGLWCGSGSVLASNSGLTWNTFFLHLTSYHHQKFRKRMLTTSSTSDIILHDYNYASLENVPWTYVSKVSVCSISVSPENATKLAFFECGCRNSLLQSKNLEVIKFSMRPEQSVCQQSKIKSH